MGVQEHVKKRSVARQKVRPEDGITPLHIPPLSSPPCRGEMKREIQGKGERQRENIREQMLRGGRGSLLMRRGEGGGERWREGEVNE